MDQSRERGRRDMLSLNDITNVSFRKAGFSGYRPEDVDAFIDQVRDTVEELTQKSLAQREEMERVEEEKRQMQKKIELLAGKIEDYRSEEDEIKNALVSAQKLGDASIREARHKAEIILKDANLKAEHIIAGAEEQIQQQKQQMADLKKQVAEFRAQLLEMYRRHLTLIDALPGEKKEEPAPQPAPSIPEPAADVPEEEQVELEPAFFEQRPAPVPEEVQEATLEFQANVSNFDEF